MLCAFLFKATESKREHRQEGYFTHSRLCQLEAWLIFLRLAPRLQTVLAEEVTSLLTRSESEHRALLSGLCIWIQTVWVVGTRTHARL